MKTAVLIRTRHPSDPVTECSYEWSEAVKQQLEINGWQVIDLAIDNAITSQVESTLQNAKSDVIIFYGHGLPDCMMGQNEKAVINLDNVTLLKNQKNYVVACLTTQELGKKAENIACCYLGYDKEVVLWFDYDYHYCLGECVNKGILEMLNTPAYTFEQARKKMIAEYEYWIEYFGSSGEKSDAEFAADLIHNCEALRLLGDRNATL